MKIRFLRLRKGLRGRRQFLTESPWRLAGLFLEGAIECGRRLVADAARDSRRSYIVEAVDAGWAVHVEGVDNPMIFRSGRAAESAGRDLAMKLAKNERSVRLELRLRGGAVAARFMVLPPITQDDQPLMIGTPPIPDRAREPLRPASVPGRADPELVV